MTISTDNRTKKILENLKAIHSKTNDMIRESGLFYQFEETNKLIDMWYWMQNWTYTEKRHEQLKEAYSRYENIQININIYNQ